MLSFVASWDYLVGEKKKNHSVTLVAKHCSPPSVRSKADHSPHPESQSMAISTCVL